VLRLVLVRLVLEPREWVQRQVWALVARVLGMIVMVPKAQALARTEAAQPTVAAYANQGCAPRPWSRALKRSKHQETQLAL
jgi:hypothetical protein